METRIKLINLTLDEFIKKNRIDTLSAVEASEILDKKGILKDSKSRKGSPLRKLLRFLTHIK